MGHPLVGARGWPLSDARRQLLRDGAYDDPDGEPAPPWYEAGKAARFDAQVELWGAEVMAAERARVAAHWARVQAHRRAVEAGRARVAQETADRHNEEERLARFKGAA